MRQLTFSTLATIVLACSVAPEQPATAPTTTTPAAVYNAILARYDSGVTTLIVDDSMSACWDLLLPQNSWVADTLSPPLLEAALACRDTTASNLPVPFAELVVDVPLIAQSDPRRPDLSMKSPLLFLSRVGFSADSSVAAAEVYWDCGGGLCASQDMYWLRRSGVSWEIIATWNISAS